MQVISLKNDETWLYVNFINLGHNQIGTILCFVYWIELNSEGTTFHSYFVFKTWIIAD